MAFGNRRDTHVCRADEAEVLLEGDDEHDALVVVLQNVGVPLIVDTGHDDVAALHQLYGGAHRHMHRVIEQLLHPRAGRIHHATRIDRPLLTMIGIA